jgi:hypothetical protein
VRWGEARAVLPWCVVAMLLALFVALVPLGGMAHVTDEVAYTLQARLFSHGLRVGPAFPAPSMLDYPFWVSAPQSYSPFPPGWPALLAVGVGVGAPWVVNVLLVGFFPMIVWLLAREVMGAREAGIATVVAAVSPQVALLAGSRMSQLSVLVALGFAALVVVRARDPLPAWIGAGLAVGYVVLARPFDAFLLGGPLLLWGLTRAPKLVSLAALLALPGAAAALLLWDNAGLTGDPFSFPMTAWFEQWAPGGERPGCNSLGFGEDIGCVDIFGERGHTPGKALQIGIATAGRLDGLLLGIPGGFILALIGLFQLRRAAPLVLTVLVVGGYALYWSPGLAYGARFWAPLMLVLPLGLATVLARLPRWMPHAIVAVVALAGGSRLIPDLSNGYWCVNGSARAMLVDEGFSTGVVMLHARGSRVEQWPALGVTDFTCDAMLEAGELFQDLDPVSSTDGLQPRHVLADPAEIPVYLEKFHPDAPVVVLQHDIAVDQYRLVH